MFLIANHCCRTVLGATAPKGAQRRRRLSVVLACPLASFESPSAVALPLEALPLLDAQPSVALEHHDASQRTLDALQLVPDSLQSLTVLAPQGMTAASHVCVCVSICIYI